jgi:hypothetical protein
MPRRSTSEGRMYWGLDDAEKELDEFQWVVGAKFEGISLGNLRVDLWRARCDGEEDGGGGGISVRDPGASRVCISLLGGAVLRSLLIAQPHCRDIPAAQSSGFGSLCKA